MELSNKSIETLVDLVEIKLSCIQVLDREDAREVKTLQNARVELYGLLGISPRGEVIPMQALSAAGRMPRLRTA